MKHSVPPPRAHHRRALAISCLLTLASACQPSDRANDPPTRADSATRGDSAKSLRPPSAPTTAATGERFVGKLLYDVVPDSAFWGSWSLYPLERHIGLRVAQLADGWWLLADTLVGYDGPKALWRIRAAISVPAPRKGEGYVGSCTRLGAPANDGSIVASVTHAAGEELTQIHSAFRLDPASWTLRPFPTDSLSCYNEGDG